MSVEDYALFGLDYSATSENVRFAYRKILQDNHPNKKGNFDNTKIDSITKAYGRIMERSLKSNYLDIPLQIKKQTHMMNVPTYSTCVPFGELRHIEYACPSINEAYDDMERRMKSLRVHHEQDPKVPKGDEIPFYSKVSYLVRKNGKTYTKIQENINGDLREFEEYKYD
jgi:DnaJ-class molecular chaperone